MKPRMPGLPPHGVKTTFWTFILSNRSYASTALDRGMIFSNMKLIG